jgi:integrase
MAKGGSITKKTNGKWKWTGYYIDLNGKEHRPNRTFNTKKEAVEFQRLQLKDGTTIKNYKNATDFTVEKFFKFWFENYCKTERRYSYNTSSRWLSVFNNHIIPVIGGCKIDNINYERFQKYLSGLDLTAKSKNNIVSALKSMLSIAYKRRIIEDTYKQDLDRLDTTGKPSKRSDIYNVMEEEEFQRLITHMYEKGYYYAPALEFLHETGLRSEEISFKDKDLILNQDGKTGTLTVAMAVKRKKALDGTGQTVESEILKSKHAYRVIPLSYTAILCIKKQQAFKKANHIKSEFVFCSQVGTPVNKDNFRIRFKAAIRSYNQQYPNEQISEDFGLHAMRKLFCKKAYEAAGIYAAQHALGHSNASVTEQYYKGYDRAEIDTLQYGINEKDKNLLKQKQEQEQEQERIEKELEEEHFYLYTVVGSDSDVGDQYVDDHPEVIARLKRKGLL